MVQTTINDKASSADSTSTSTSKNTYDWHCPYVPQAQQGWECPRCGHINAPWVRQCDCTRSNWTITWASDQPSQTGDRPEWRKEVTCQGTNTILDSDTFKVNPDSTIYQVGGSDYKIGDTYVNVGGTQSNKVDPNVTVWSCTNPNNCHTPHYTTETIVNDGIHNFYNLRTSKETK